mgnify:CR=1 FL=1
MMMQVMAVLTGSLEIVPVGSHLLDQMVSPRLLFQKKAYLLQVAFHREEVQEEHRLDQQDDNRAEDGMAGEAVRRIDRNDARNGQREQWQREENGYFTSQGKNRLLR